LLRLKFILAKAGSEKAR